MSSTKSIAVCLVAIFLSSSLFAQNIWLADTAEYIGLEYTKASFKGPSDASFFSGVFHVYGSKRIGRNLYLNVDVPILNLNDDDDSETSFGNVQVGLKLGTKKPSTYGKIAAILPTVDEDKPSAIGRGFLTDPLRIEVVMPWAWGLIAKINHEQKLNNKGLYFKVNGGFVFFRDTKSVSQFDEPLENYLFADYMLQFGFLSTDNIKFSAAVEGRTGINDVVSEVFFGKRSAYMADLGVSYKGKHIEPGLLVKIPLSDPFKDALSNTVTFSLIYHFGSNDSLY
ncbi:hypothetical protein [Reichenbachiella sp.]|uniref:hypothetical protein n=1 Tax=Reichenbachiella sp. TaxID=2184521 RepID=UPI003BAF1BE3